METIKKRLRGLKYKVYTRINANIPVFTSGNEVRMGKGKGSFDYWATRVAVSKIIFELKGELHEQVVKDAFRLAAAKMPGRSSLLTLERKERLMRIRTVRVCEEGRSSGYGHYESWSGCDIGGYEEAKNAAKGVVTSRCDSSKVAGNSTLKRDLIYRCIMASTSV